MELSFILKKIISAMMMPLSIGLLFLLIAIFFLYKNNIKKTKIFLIIGFLTIFITSHVSFSSSLLKPLESQYKKLDIVPKDIKYILLLGGDFQNRAWEVLRLYHQLPDAKIITSGYQGRGDVPEAIKSANKLIDIGIKKENIIIHSKPKDTKEEVIKIKELLGKEKFILITSAYHMSRAMALFKKEGLNPIAAPSDFKIKQSDKFLSVPNGSALHKTDQAWHEYIGLLWSKIRGQI